MALIERVAGWVARSKVASPTTKVAKPVNERVFGTSSQFRDVVVPAEFGKPGRDSTPGKYMAPLKY